MLRFVRKCMAARAIALKAGLILFPIMLAAGCGKFFLPGNALVAINVTPSNPSVQAGQTQQFAATGTTANGGTSALSSVTWTSSSSNVASISTSGLATVAASAANGNTTIITATSSNVSGTTTLTVGTSNTGGLTITCSGCTQQSTGAFTASLASGSVTFIATNSSSQIVSPTWNSSSTAVATINSGTGTATLVGTGTTTISATASGASGSVTLTVQ
jgi:trimeric autotransporter adhesin